MLHNFCGLPWDDRGSVLAYEHCLVGLDENDTVTLDGSKSSGGASSVSHLLRCMYGLDEPALLGPTQKMADCNCSITHASFPVDASVIGTKDEVLLACDMETTGLQGGWVVEPLNERCLLLRRHLRMVKRGCQCKGKSHRKACVQVISCQSIIPCLISSEVTTPTHSQKSLEKLPKLPP